MNHFSDILEKARNYLCSGWTADKTIRISSPRAAPEVVFVHSLRVLELAKLLSKTSGHFEDQTEGICLWTAAMFHDSGWIDLVKKGLLHPSEIFVRPADKDILDRSISVVSDQLCKLIPARIIDKIAKTIAGLKDTKPNQTNSIILSDADNLEDFGVLGFTFQVRTAQSSGKSTRQLLESFRRQQEYHYWEARIKNAFHLEISKAIARQRLESMGKIFDLLSMESEFLDVQELLSKQQKAQASSEIATA